MREQFDVALEIILEHEGGFVNHPLDPGGMTNKGITKRVYENWIGKEVDESIMRGLTTKDVSPIYKIEYWNKIKGDDLPKGVDLCVFDFAVNAGVSRASKLLQKLVEAGNDGIIGPNTLGKVNNFLNKYSLDLLIMGYQLDRLSYYQSLSTFDTFGRGWTRRNNSTTIKALEWANDF